MIRVVDTETCLFRPGVMAPELVCVTFQVPGEQPGIVHHEDPVALPLVRRWLAEDVLVGHHVAYDLAVLCARWPEIVPLAFRAYDEDRVVCTKVRQQLLDIAAGQFRGYLRKFRRPVCTAHEDCDPEVCPQATVKQGARWVPHDYDLDALTYRATGRHLEKDAWRLRYGEFLHVPLSGWVEHARGLQERARRRRAELPLDVAAIKRRPKDFGYDKDALKALEAEVRGLDAVIADAPEGVVRYPLEDARATLDVFLKQEEHARYIPDQFRQARAALALHLTSVWGLRTHGPGVDKLEQETRAALAAIEGDLQAAGLVRRDGSRDTKAAKRLMVEACEAAGKPVRLTDKGNVSLDSDACEASENDLLEDYAELTSLKNVLNKDIPVLRAGTVFPVHTSFGMAASGRATSGNPNIQNFRRLPGIRECFYPREGKVFAIADFSGLELHTLAQVCVTLFGQSHLAEVLNAGLDPHTALAADILGISYEDAVRRKKAGDEAVDNARQTAKVANFGYPGGLGAEKFCLFARKSYGVILTEERAKELKEQWLMRWPEMRLFFKHVGDLVDEDTGEALVKQLFSERWRGGCHYTAGCNTWFQGLGADANKRAYYLVVRACYAEPENVLYGSRAVNSVHDESIIEVDDDPRAHDKAMELGRLMILGANEFLPDVPARVEPLLARFWSKKAKPVFVEGRLVPWAA